MLTAWNPALRTEYFPYKARVTRVKNTVTAVYANYIDCVRTE